MPASRKGARRRADITPDVQRGLDRGTLETASLPEALAVDFQTLMKSVAPAVPAGDRRTLDPALGITTRMQVAGRLLHQHYGAAAYDEFSAHTSDTVRGWAAYALGANESLRVAARIKQIQKLADDPHFGVREWAWIAVRPQLTLELATSIRLLVPWTKHQSANIRRFAVECLRPRGVWCAHITQLKTRPDLALPLLEPLRADPSKYVQDSVANWLNDASKTQPEWVREVCADWLRESNSPFTQRICKRAQRSLQGK